MAATAKSKEDAEKERVVKLLHESILHLCKVSCSSTGQTEVDGIVVITTGDGEGNIVVKVHEKFGEVAKKVQEKEKVSRRCQSTESRPSESTTPSDSDKSGGGDPKTGGSTGTGRKRNNEALIDLTEMPKKQIKQEPDNDDVQVVGTQPPRLVWSPRGTTGPRQFGPARAQMRPYRSQILPRPQHPQRVRLIGASSGPIPQRVCTVAPGGMNYSTSAVPTSGVRVITPEAPSRQHVQQQSMLHNPGNPIPVQVSPNFSNTTPVKGSLMPYFSGIQVEPVQSSPTNTIAPLAVIEPSSPAEPVSMVRVNMPVTMVTATAPQETVRVASVPGRALVMPVSAAPVVQGQVRMATTAGASVPRCVPGAPATQQPVIPRQARNTATTCTSVEASGSVISVAPAPAPAPPAAPINIVPEMPDMPRRRRRVAPDASRAVAKSTTERSESPFAKYGLQSVSVKLLKYPEGSAQAPNVSINLASGAHRGSSVNTSADATPGSVKKELSTGEDPQTTTPQKKIMAHYSCGYGNCYFKTVKRSFMKMHCLKHIPGTDVRSLTCGHHMCEFRCASTPYMQQHLVKVHRSKGTSRMQICNNCLVVYTQRAQYTKHVKSCSNVRFDCEICMKCINSRLEYASHLANHYKQDSAPDSAFKADLEEEETEGDETLSIDENQDMSMSQGEQDTAKLESTATVANPRERPVEPVLKVAESQLPSNQQPNPSALNVRNPSDGNVEQPSSARQDPTLMVPAAADEVKMESGSQHATDAKQHVPIRMKITGLRKSGTTELANASIMETGESVENNYNNNNNNNNNGSSSVDKSTTSTSQSLLSGDSPARSAASVAQSPHPASPSMPELRLEMD